MTINSELIFRPQKQPSSDVPFGARSVGSVSFDGAGDYRQEHIGRPMAQIFWFYEGRGHVWIGDDRFEVEADDILVYFPDSIHRLEALHQSWAWRFWTMDGPVMRSLLEGFGLVEGVYRAGPCPHDLFLLLREAIRDISASGERHASAIAYQLMTRASFAQDGDLPGVVAQVLNFVDEEWNNPELTVQQLADLISMNRSQFTRLFTQHVGMSPIAYITSKRVQNAQGMLKRDISVSVTEIAYACGFTDPSYFTRVFRQRSGMTPLQFRQS